ncbi:LPP20 family lipoprotein [Enterovibrio norvegicus]|uniref:LPP20 family lipoprotein n=1 Tax=Enterovibrio norvegicus TaxID=188144 RepID=UPI001F532E75|nr:LPP20 family lipoprotein [Enterovibrio norvegicus]
MKNIKKKMFIRVLPMVFFPVFFSGCKSTTPPDWYAVETVNHPEYVYAAGEGRSLNLAKKSALSGVNSQLWTQVDSTFSMNDVYKKINDNTTSYESTSNKINAKSAQVTLTGVEYVRSEKNDVAYYVQARVGRDNIKSQLLSEVKQIESAAKLKIDNLSHQDKLIWWLDNRGSEAKLEDLYVRLAILSSLGSDEKNSVVYLPKLLGDISKVKSELLVSIRPDKKDKKSAAFISEKFSKEEIATTQSSSRQATHILTMKSEYRRGMVGDAYITTKLTDLVLKNKSGKTLASNEIISTGNSMTSYKLSQEGAERHFSALLEEAGIWQAVGLKK